MKVLSFIDEENKRLYDIQTIMKILGVSKSKVQREIKRNNFSNELIYKNQFLYSQNTLFGLMEKILIEKLEKIND
jgi:IS30 family transposase